MLFKTVFLLRLSRNCRTMCCTMAISGTSQRVVGTEHSDRCALSRLPLGASGVIPSDGLPEAERSVLHAMGLWANVRVRMCRVGEPMVVRIESCAGCSCRIGLSRALADRVFVEAPTVER